MGQCYLNELMYFECREGCAKSAHSPVPCDDYFGPISERHVCG